MEEPLNKSARWKSYSFQLLTDFNIVVETPTPFSMDNVHKNGYLFSRNSLINQTKYIAVKFQFVEDNVHNKFVTSFSIFFLTIIVIFNLAFLW